MFKVDWVPAPGAVSQRIVHINQFDLVERETDFLVSNPMTNTVVTNTLEVINTNLRYTFKVYNTNVSSVETDSNSVEGIKYANNGSLSINGLDQLVFNVGQVRSIQLVDYEVYSSTDAEGVTRTLLNSGTTPLAVPGGIGDGFNLILDVTPVADLWYLVRFKYRSTINGIVEDSSSVKHENTWYETNIVNYLG